MQPAASISPLRAWLLAARPKTLWAAVAPVIVGASVAYTGATQPQWFWLLPILLCALLIQVGTNLANDYFDFLKGTDTADRVGPVRVTQAGLLTPDRVRLGMLLTFSLAMGMALLLAYRGGWVIILLGLLAVCCGIGYTAGPFPLAYTGAADVFVLVFFGPVASVATEYILHLQISITALLGGLSCGLLSTAVLTVNNLRDIDDDRRTGKKTLAVRFGIQFARAEYMVCVWTAMLIPLLLAWESRTFLFLLPLLSACLLWRPQQTVMHSRGAVLNQSLADTARALLLFSVCFGLAVLLS